MVYVLALNLVEHTTFGQDEKKERSWDGTRMYEGGGGKHKEPNLPPSSAFLDARSKNGTWGVLTTVHGKRKGLWTALLYGALNLFTNS